MKLSVNRSALLAALAHASAIVGKGGSHFMASCALLTAAPDGLTVQATDGVSVSVRARVDGADVKEAGAIAISARDAFDRVKAMPEAATLDVSIKDDKLTIKAGARKFTLRTFPANEMPAWPSSEKGAAVVLPGVAIRDALGIVSHAMCSDSSRADMHGALLGFDGETLRSDGADGARLAAYDRVVAPLTDELSPFSAILAARAVGIVERIASADRVSITRTGTRLFIEAGLVTLAVSTVAATFPPTRKVIEMIKSGASGDVSRVEFLDAVRSVGLSATSAGHGILMRIGEDALSLSAEGQGGDAASDTVALANWSATKAEAIYPCAQLTEALSAAPDDTITIGFEDNRAIVIRSGAGDAAATFVVMPIAPKVAA